MDDSTSLHLDSEPVDRSIGDRYWVIDLETNADRADPSEHEIIEFAGVLIEGAVETATFSSLARPTRPISKDVSELTGLTDGDLRDAPTMGHTLGEFLNAIGNLPVIAHNGFGYDYVVLDASCKATERGFLPGVRLDLLELAHLAFPRVGGSPDIDATTTPADRTLDGLAAHLHIERRGSAHRALSDARLAADLARSLTDLLNAETPRRRLQRWTLEAGDHPWSAFLREERERIGLATCLAPARRTEPTEPTGVFDPQRAIDPLRPGGALITEGRVHRPTQVAMADRVAGSFASKQSVLIEAPTGTGKTLAYLVPSIAWARASGTAVAIATHTKVLQDQVTETLENLRSTFSGLTWVVLKGRDNYVDLESLDAYLDGGPRDADDALALAIIVGWVGATSSGDWSDLRAWAVEHRIPRLTELKWLLKVEHAPGVALSELEEQCFYRRAITGVANADVVVMNHAVLMRRTDWFEPVTNLVVDEVHTLEDTATAALTDSTSELVVERILESIAPTGRRRGALGRYREATGAPATSVALQRLQSAILNCRRSLDGFTDALTQFLRERLGARREVAEKFGIAYRLRRGLDTGDLAYRPVRHGAHQLGKDLSDLSRSIADLPVPEQVRRPYRRRGIERELGRLARRAHETAKLVRDVVFCDEPDDDELDEREAATNTGWIFIADLGLEEDRWTWTLRRAPVSVAPSLEMLWKELDGTVLTSATASVAGDFGPLVDQLGLGAIQAVRLESPFERLSENHLLVLVDHLPTPRGGLLDEFTFAEADEIARLVVVARGGGLCLFTARSRMEFVRDHCRPQVERFGLPVLCQGEGPSPALAERMRDERSASLLALRSFWEGIDVPGESLKLLVIEKLPFDPPNDPIVAARMDEAELRGRDPFADYLVPRAALRLVQGIGRLIRSEDDVGASVVLDKRLRRPTAYRDAFLGSVPGPPTVLRPATADDAYASIAKHLSLDLDVETRQRLSALESSDPWGELDALRLDPDECADAAMVTERLERIRNKLGFPSWRPGQVEVMTRIIADQDTLAVMPTGSGKSLTYQIPALLLPGLTLVVSPLVALMRDQVEGLRELGVMRVGAIHSGVSQSEQAELLAGARGGRYTLLYVSPERLWSFKFREGLRGIPIARVVVDEAHCVSQWGHSFRPEYASIPDAVSDLGAAGSAPTRVAVTATATADVRDEIVELLHLETNEPVVVSPDRPELRYFVERCENASDRDLRVLQIVQAFRGKSVIVYVPRRQDTQRISGILRAADLVARPYHGGMETPARINVEEAFRYGEIDVVVATKAFGLGIDKPDIAAIVHLEMPASVEEYVQETGRAARGARDGIGDSTGYCVLLTMPRDCGIHRNFIRSAAPSLEDIKRVWKVLVGAQEFCAPPADLAKQAGFEGRDIERVGLAVHYLVRCGAVQRDVDVIWEGRVFVPKDADEVLKQVASRDAQLARYGQRLVRQIRALGTDEYNARGWSARLGLKPQELERDLLELQRHDVIGVTSWGPAWQLHCDPHFTPDWGVIDKLARGRRQLVEGLSDKAKQYARQGTCRRGFLLRYLGVEATNRCSGCDVCDPHIDRPWSGLRVEADQLADALPAESIWIALLRDVDGEGFSLETLIRALCAQAGQFENVRLQAHPSYGRLAPLGRDRSRDVFDRLCEQGLAELEDRTYNERRYRSPRLTELGRHHR